MTPICKRHSLSLFAVIAGCVVALPACNLTIGGLSFGAKETHEGGINTYYHAPRWHLPADAAPEDGESPVETQEAEDEGYLSIDDSEEFTRPSPQLWDE